MSVLVQRNSTLALPGGLWPSLLVLLLAATVPSVVLLIGYATIEVLPQQSRFMPQYRVPWFSESVVKYKMDYALQSDEYNDVVFLGASATMAGVDTSSFQRATGLRAYNFGTNIGVGPDGHVEILKTYLKSHPTPRLVVYTAFPRDLSDAWVTDLDFRDRFVKTYAPALRVRDGPFHRGPRFYFQEGYWFLDQAVRSGFQDPLDAPRGSRPSHRELGPLLAQERGYQPYPQGLVLDLSYLEEMDAFHVSRWYRDSFADLAEVARRNDIGLILWVMPIPEPNSSVEDTPLMTWAEQFQSEYPEVEVAGLPVETYEHGLWGNAFHFNEEGAEVFTGQVSQRVVKLLDTDRQGGRGPE